MIHTCEKPRLRSGALCYPSQISSRVALRRSAGTCLRGMPALCFACIEEASQSGFDSVGGEHVIGPSAGR